MIQDTGWGCIYRGGGWCLLRKASRKPTRLRALSTTAGQGVQERRVLPKLEERRRKAESRVVIFSLEKINHVLSRQTPDRTPLFLYEPVGEYRHTKPKGAQKYHLPFLKQYRF